MIGTLTLPFGFVNVTGPLVAPGGTVADSASRHALSFPMFDAVQP